MKISPTDAFQPAAASGAGFLLVFLDESGEAERWLLLDGGEVATRGEGEPPAPDPGVKLALAVPGSQATVHWLELAVGLTEAQAAAAARLLLADATPDPLAELHVAVGRPERGLTPVGLVPVRLMTQWLARFDAHLIVPGPLLLPAAEESFVRHRDDYRASAAAFTLEPELAQIVLGDSAVTELDSSDVESGLEPILSAPPLNLRQGAFAKRRRWKSDSGHFRRIGWLVLTLAVLSLAVEVARLLAFTFAADRLEAEARSVSAQTGATETQAFSPIAGNFFEAVRSTPNIEVARLEYRPDGSLQAAVAMDNPATLAAFRSRLESSGLVVEPGAQQSSSGRPMADLTVRLR